MSAPLEENLESRGTDLSLTNSPISPVKPWEQGQGGTHASLERAARAFLDRADRAPADPSSTATATTLHPDRHIATTEKGGGLFRGKGKVREDNGTDDKGTVGSSHHHWCTKCEHPKIIVSCDGWKRHMREHEVVYSCNMCTGNDLEYPYRKKHVYSRRVHLTRHLSAFHDIPHEEAKIMSKKWCAEARKAYACGFCIQTFRTRSDQLNHIDREHWRHSQDISEWDLNKVIQGLLLQPNIQPIWLRLVRDTSSATRNFTWNRSDAEGLIERLELGEEPADDLAAAAVSQLRPVYVSPITARYWNPKDGKNRPRVEPFQRVADIASDSSSDAESVESGVDSVASSRTSVVSDRFSLSAVDGLVTWLLQNAELGVIYQAALESSHVGADRFERTFRRILNQYSRELEKEARNRWQISAAVLVRRRSGYIANKFRQNHVLNAEAPSNPNILKVEQYLKSVTLSLSLSSSDEPSIRDEELDELSSLDSDTSADGLDDKLPELTQIKAFMFASRALLALRATTWQLIDHSLKPSLEKLTTEIECCRAPPIDISHEAMETILDQVKAVVERFTRASWDWWPLKPRRGNIPAGYARIRWYCVSVLTCNVARANSTSLVGRSVAKMFQDFLQSRSFGLRPVSLDLQLSSMPSKELVKVKLPVIVRPVMLQHRLQCLTAGPRAYTRVILLNVILLSSKRSA